MIRKTELLEPARQELAVAFDWYMERSVSAAEGFINEVERGIHLIAQDPSVWPFLEADARRYPLRKYPYNILYRESGAIIFVIAVAHQRRQPGYWKNR